MVFARTIAPFSNLSTAGAELAEACSRLAGADLVVLGMLSAGVPVAVEVAKYLAAPLDLVIIRRLLTPQGPGSQAAAVNVAGSLLVDEQIGPRPATPQSPFDYFMEDALHGLEERTQICRGKLPPANLAGKKLLLVDCAIRSGLTMKSAIEALRRLGPAKITAAVPVTSAYGRDIIQPLTDELIYLAAPEPFGNAGVWFKDFGRPADEEVSELLKPSLRAG